MVIRSEIRTNGIDFHFLPHAWRNDSGISRNAFCEIYRSRQSVGGNGLWICVCFADYGIDRGPFAGIIELQIPDYAIEIQGLDDVVMIPQRLN